MAFQPPSLLFSKIRTSEEAQQLRAEITRLLTSLFEGQIVWDRARTQIRSWVSAIIHEELPKDLNQQKNYLQLILSGLDQLEEVELTLAFEPTEKMLSAIYSYIAQSTGPGIILNLHCDPDILAGIKIVFRGQYRDFSLNQQFDQAFAKSMIDNKTSHL
jgi:F0F1-type ATP synthase delta subunit